MYVLGAAVAESYPTIRRGSRGEAVSRAQALLQARLGAPWNIAADGIFGPITESATKEFQKRNKDASGVALVVDGIIGPRTWSALVPLSYIPGAPAAGRTPRPPSAPSAPHLPPVAPPSVRTAGIFGNPLMWIASSVLVYAVYKKKFAKK